MPLSELNIFTGDEINLLADAGIKNTEQYYNEFVSKSRDTDPAHQASIPSEKLLYALHITDLLRINGVGVEYAKILYEIGVKSITDYNKTASETILTSVRKLNAEKAYTKASLGISDIDYCRRFCERLDCEIG